MYTHWILPLSRAISILSLAVTVLPSKPGKSAAFERTLVLAQRLFERANDEKLWSEGISGVSGMRDLMRWGARLASLAGEHPDLAGTHRELLWKCAKLYIVTRYCIYFEAPLKATILPALPRRAAWKSAKMYDDIKETYEIAIEIE